MTDSAPKGPLDAGSSSKPLDPRAGDPATAELRLDAEGMRMLLEVSRRINAERDPESLLAAVVDSLVTVTKADRGFLMLREGTGLRFALARDRKGRPLEAEKFRVSESVAKEVSETGETRLIDDAASSDAYHARLSIINLSLRTILCVALKTARGILGVIYVDSNAITRRFSERDVPLIEAFAAQAAVSLERVRLEQAEIERDRMRRQLETAAEIQQMFLPGQQMEIVSGWRPLHQRITVLQMLLLQNQLPQARQMRKPLLPTLTIIELCSRVQEHGTTMLLLHGH